MSVASVSLNILAIVLFIVWAAIWSFHFFALAYGKYKFHKKTKRVLEVDKLPGVSIIKPLMGIDDNLKENLETFFTLEYPLYELLFCVQDNVDPVISLVQGLIEKYPTVDAKLFTGGTNVGINPKINNMQQGYEVAKYELFMVSDAGLKSKL
jgi:ceramide glucosyltransferase